MIELGTTNINQAYLGTTPIYLYQLGTTTIRYEIPTSIFDGTNDFLTKTGGLSGAADSKTGILSLWVKFNGGDGTRQDILYNSTGIVVRRQNNNKLEIYGFTTGVVQNMFMSSTGTITADGNFHHVLASWDLAAGVGYLYIDGTNVLDTGTDLFSNSNVIYSGLDFYVGASGAGSNMSNATYGQIYFNTAASIDLSNAANRAKFYKGSPVYMGPTGAIPTGSQPILYLNNPYTTFQTNLGSGGNFTVTGALTDGGRYP